MPTTWYQGSVTAIKDESPTTKRFWITIEDQSIFQFRAGQFVTFDLPIGEKRLQRWRSYSIASAPNEGNQIELCIVKLDNGAGTEYFFNTVEIGTLLKFKGPDGTFCLPDNLTDDIVMICTGTGVAPFRSMLHDVLRKQKINTNIHLIFGCRTANDILYRSEFETLAEEYPNFTYSIALSRENVSGTVHGYVHQIYLSAYAKQRSNIKFYICGWSKMIDEAVENLFLKLNYERSQIIYELYG